MFVIEFTFPKDERPIIRMGNLRGGNTSLTDIIIKQSPLFSFDMILTLYVFQKKRMITIGSFNHSDYFYNEY